ncbi:Malonyl-coenzyme A:anthocyanin 3-O-glucoside-6-O-malonyltransferase [Ananas comosus]|uniref:Malonyl-coenzyme A:anthocyanin 3-O-glucoside-6-O-malonyltransferase n=1 Tax=Ananas comosus TaxID=4615 RepID=A0A199VFJ4_ANACO|nr:Malonyl-coenzyme A:anthocyanin 3-O-glucoside-6-O-malonyltransferase [Ananas comosus]
MASPPPPIRILRRISISPPASSAAAAAAAAAALPLTFFDAAWLFTGPIERLFFYALPHSTSHFVAHLLPQLASSLSLALLRFPPLLGRVRPAAAAAAADDDDVDFAFSFSSSDDSVPLTVAESSDDFDALSSPGPRDFANLHALIPPLPRPGDGSIPLTAVQVTVFPRRGVALGIAIHHAACDDSSFLHFVKSWAAACKLGGAVGLPLPLPFPPPPSFDRGAIPDPAGLRAKTLAELTRLAAHGPPPEPEPARPNAVLGSFSLGRAQIERLKRALVAKARESGAAVHCSSFVVACAFAWVCLLRAQEGHAAQEKAHLLFSVECRARLSPPIPAEYFGNCLRPCFVEAATEALLEEAGGVSEAALAIGEAIKGLERGGVLEGAEGWLGRILGLVPARPMSVGGSPRFRVYDADFGWGRPRKVELLSIAKTPGTISLAESGAAAGDDDAVGIEIGVVLPRHEMETFRRCFSQKLLRLL